MTTSTIMRTVMNTTTTIMITTTITMIMITTMTTITIMGTVIIMIMAIVTITTITHPVRARPVTSPNRNLKPGRFDPMFWLHAFAMSVIP